MGRIKFYEVVVKLNERVNERFWEYIISYSVSFIDVNLFYFV